MLGALKNLGSGLGSTMSGAGKLAALALTLPPAVGAMTGLGSVLAGESALDDKTDLERAKLRAKIRSLQNASREIEESKGLK